MPNHLIQKWFISQPTAACWFQLVGCFAQLIVVSWITHTLPWWRDRLPTRDVWISYCQCIANMVREIFSGPKALPCGPFFLKITWISIWCYVLSSCRLIAGIISWHNWMVSQLISASNQLLWGAYQRQMIKNKQTNQTKPKKNLVKIVTLHVTKSNQRWLQQHKFRVHAFKERKCIFHDFPRNI